MIDRNRVIENFKKYTENYDIDNPKVKLKVTHTYRVAGLCEGIARSLELSEKEIDLCWLMGMLHDIGRFEQLRRFDTFIDSKSINHAHFGVELLFDEGLINDYVSISGFQPLQTLEEEPSRGVIFEGSSQGGALPDELKLLRTAVYNHSSLKLPEDLTEKETLFCNILRDADKIDILKANSDFALEDIYNCTRAELLSSPVGREVMAAFDKGGAIPSSIKVHPTDYIVGHIAMCNELVFPYSRAKIKEQGYLKKMMYFESENEETQRDFEYIRSKMKEFI